MRIAIVDYAAGNLRSVQRACQEVGLEAFISADPAEVLAADKVIFPGVGSAVSAVDTLHQRGLFDALLEFHQTGKPVLGICLGCQIVLEYTEEGNKDCLALIRGVVERFDFADRHFKVPHMGWNSVEIQQSHPLLQEVSSGDEFYFVHAYYVRPTDAETIIGMTDYNIEFCSILAKDNLFATQFHLEKSGKKGLSILEAFGRWDGGSHVK